MALHAASQMVRGRSSTDLEKADRKPMTSFRSALFRLPLLVAFACGATIPAFAKPVTIQERKTPPQVPASQRFLEGVAAYDVGAYKAAFDIWLPLAQQHDLAAMRNVGLMLRKGIGTKRDPKRALYFYEEAARSGYVAAQLNTAFMYLMGDEGVPKNPEAAAYWFHLCAIAGLPVAQYNLGVLYERGEGVIPDHAKALAWYALAAHQGHELALKRLQILVPSLPGPTPPTPADAAADKLGPTPPPAEYDSPQSDTTAP